MAFLKQNTTYTRSFFMIESANHANPAFGVTPTILISKAGSPLGSAAGSVTEFGGGWYKVNLTTVDTNTLGDLAFYITATYCDTTLFVDQVIAVDLMDAVAFGLSRIDAAISSRSTYAGGAVASVTGSVGSVTGNVGGNVTGSVGSVVGNVGGNVNGAVVGSVGYVSGPVLGDVNGNLVGNVGGSVIGHVYGDLKGKVDGAVASVSGNVNGNVVGSVGSVVGGIGGAISSVTTVGSVTGSVGSVTSPVDITQGAADKVWNSASRTLSSFGSLIADIWNAVTRTLTSSSALSTGDKDAIINGVLGRDIGTVPAPASRSLLNAVRFLRNKWSIAGGVLTVTQENDATVAWTAAVTTTPTAEPITTVDPT